MQRRKTHNSHVQGMPGQGGADDAEYMQLLPPPPLDLPLGEWGRAGSSHKCKSKRQEDSSKSCCWSPTHQLRVCVRLMILHCVWHMSQGWPHATKQKPSLPFSSFTIKQRHTGAAAAAAAAASTVLTYCCCCCCCLPPPPPPTPLSPPPDHCEL